VIIEIDTVTIMLVKFMFINFWIRSFNFGTQQTYPMSVARHVLGMGLSSVQIITQFYK